LLALSLQLLLLVVCLFYISEAFMTAGGIFGVSIYFNSKIGEFSTNTATKIGQMIDAAFDKHKEDLH